MVVPHFSSILNLIWFNLQRLFYHAQFHYCHHRRGLHESYGKNSRMRRRARVFCRHNFLICNGVEKNVTVPFPVLKFNEGYFLFFGKHKANLICSLESPCRYYGWPWHSQMLFFLCTLVKRELKYKEFVFMFKECDFNREGDGCILFIHPFFRKWYIFIFSI